MAHLRGHTLPEIRRSSQLRPRRGLWQNTILMLYAIIARDVADSRALRAQTRAKHFAYLQDLVDEGRVVLAGPHPAIDSPDPGPAGFSGSLIVAEFDSLESARAWAAGDPYMQNGIFQDVTVKPFIQVQP